LVLEIASPKMILPGDLETRLRFPSPAPLIINNLQISAGKVGKVRRFSAFSQEK
jgi:hypothetical protein